MIIINEKDHHCRYYQTYLHFPYHLGSIWLMDTKKSENGIQIVSFYRYIELWYLLPLYHNTLHYTWIPASLAWMFVLTSYTCLAQTLLQKNCNCPLSLSSLLSFIILTIFTFLYIFHFRNLSIPSNQRRLICVR